MTITGTVTIGYCTAIRLPTHFKHFRSASTTATLLTAAPSPLQIHKLSLSYELTREVNCRTAPNRKHIREGVVILTANSNTEK